jgi:recombination protein RecR
MNHFPSSISKLIRHLCRLPGIGEKSAERLALYILNAPESEVFELSRSIGELKQKIRLCSHCFALSDADLCRICNDPSRDATILCVVETPADMVAIEKTGTYSGLFHVLGGLLSPMDGIGPDHIRLKELIQRIEKGGVKEVVIATSTNIEGEATASYIAEMLSGYSLTVTRIASGIPMGGEVKYVDQVTLRKAMEARHAF